jgi:hypothetical protein
MIPDVERVERSLVELWSFHLLCAAICRRAWHCGREVEIGGLTNARPDRSTARKLKAPCRMRDYRFWIEWRLVGLFCAVKMSSKSVSSSSVGWNGSVGPNRLSFEKQSATASA